MSAERKGFAFVERLRAKVLSRRDRPLALPPAPAEDFADELREKARDVLHGVAALTQKLHLLELSNETLRDEARALRVAADRLGDELTGERLARTQAEMRLLEAAEALETFGGALERTGVASVGPAATRLVEMAAELKREGAA